MLRAAKAHILHRDQGPRSRPCSWPGPWTGRAACAGGPARGCGRWALAYRAPQNRHPFGCSDQQRRAASRMLDFAFTKSTGPTSMSVCEQRESLRGRTPILARERKDPTGSRMGRREGLRSVVELGIPALRRIARLACLAVAISQGTKRRQAVSQPNGVPGDCCRKSSTREKGSCVRLKGSAWHPGTVSR